MSYLKSMFLRICSKVSCFLQLSSYKPNISERLVLLNVTPAPCRIKAGDRKATAHLGAWSFVRQQDSVQICMEAASSGCIHAHVCFNIVKLLFARDRSAKELHSIRRLNLINLRHSPIGFKLRKFTRKNKAPTRPKFLNLAVVLNYS